MKTKMKIQIIGVMAPLLLLPLMSSVVADESNVSNGSFEERIRQFIIQLLSQQRRHRPAVWFFKDTKSATVERTITAHYRNMLIVTPSEGQSPSIVPASNWKIDSEVVRLNKIFEEGYVSIGDGVTTKALPRTIPFLGDNMSSRKASS